uniref:Uncharacterized protein n=1 Tax=Fusarium oxysporum (strain Fo5176) TaxID=660025 RepID=A0A0D2XRA3_FUSOF
MSQIRYFYRIIILDTLRPGVLASEAPQKAQLPSQAHVPTLTQDPAVTEMLQWNDAHQDADSKAVCPRPMSWVLYSESVDDGTSLVNISVDGGRPAVAEEDVTFERKAFIDGVTYLLKALPPDLDVCELRRIPIRSAGGCCPSGPGGGSERRRLDPIRFWSPTIHSAPQCPDDRGQLDLRPQLYAAVSDVSHPPHSTNGAEIQGF